MILGMFKIITMVSVLRRDGSVAEVAPIHLDVDRVIAVGYPEYGFREVLLDGHHVLKVEDTPDNMRALGLR